MKLDQNEQALSHQEAMPVSNQRAPWKFLSRLAIRDGLILSLVLGTGWVAKQMMGAAFLDILAKQQTSIMALMTVGLGYILWMGGSWRKEIPAFSSLWMPMRLVIIAGWLLPTMAGPANEMISPLAHLMLWVLT